MKQQQLFAPIPTHKLNSFSKEEIIALLEGEQRLRVQLQKDNERLRATNGELAQKTLFVEEQYIVLKNKLFGKSSEKSPSIEDRRRANKKNAKRKKKVQLPSLRYPNAPLIEREVELKDLPSCKCCGTQMADSGMTENSEFLTVVPAQYIVVRQKRHVYRCGKCHSDMRTAPPPPRIMPKSSYSDEMVIDVALSKYCDLIPIERYSAIAGRNGLKDLPPQSLIEQTHNLADFVVGAYDKSANEIKGALALSADETPHRMLEDIGDKKSWYLWGFSTKESCYFEIHNTRSGDVASDILINSKCEYLVSDVFSGYAKAVKQVNKERAKNNDPPIVNVYCNAHARRKFDEAKEKFSEEAKYFIYIYKKIYRLEDMAKKYPSKVLRLRKLMAPFYGLMRTKAMTEIKGYSSKSSIGRAMGYFLKNYTQLTLFLKIAILPIDNNSQESLFRNPVVGRKIWYGTHSERGARTAAILFTLVEGCKLNKVNPREYFKKLVQYLHQGKAAFTPLEFKDLQN